MTRAQVVALVLLALLFLFAVAIVAMQVIWGTGGLDLDELAS